MENKITVIKILVVFVIIVCVGIICFNTIYRSNAKQEVIGYEKFQSISVISDNNSNEDWVDNFDTSYVDKTTGCIVYTRK